MPVARRFLLPCLFTLAFLSVASRADAYLYKCDLSISTHSGWSGGYLRPEYPKYYSESSDVNAIGVCQNHHNNSALDHCASHGGDHTYTLTTVVFRYANGQYGVLVLVEPVDWQCIDAYPYYAQLLSPDDKKDRPALAQLSPPAEQRAPATQRHKPVALSQSRSRFIGASAAEVFESNGNTVAVLPTLQSRMIEVFTMSSPLRLPLRHGEATSHH